MTEVEGNPLPDLTDFVVLIGELENYYGIGTTNSKIYFICFIVNKQRLFHGFFTQQT